MSEKLGPDDPTLVPVLRTTDGTLLNVIGGRDGEVSHADVLQALAITTSVRVAMADAAARRGADYSLELLDFEIVPVESAGLRAD